MRLLLDESVPRPLTPRFRSHEVETVQSMGWGGTENGDLLQLAANSGFDVLVTVDKGFEHQHNLERLPLTVAILRAKGNRLEDLEPLIPDLLEQLGKAERRTLIKVGA